MAKDKDSAKDADKQAPKPAKGRLEDLDVEKEVSERVRGGRRYISVM